MLRLARDADAQDLYGLIALCFAQFPGCYLDPHEDMPDLLRPGSALRDRNGQFWVYEDADARVGACVGIDFPQPAIAELHRLYVRPDLRGCGLATRLVGHAEDHALRHGAEWITLWSDTRFLDAHRLYVRLGYERQPGERALGDVSQSREHAFRKRLQARRMREASRRT